MEIQENEYGDMFDFKSFCGNDLLRRSLYIFKCIHGLVSIGKLTYQMICACSSAYGWTVCSARGIMRVVIHQPRSEKQLCTNHKSTARFGNQVTTEGELAFKIKQVYVSVLVLPDLS